MQLKNCKSHDNLLATIKLIQMRQWKAETVSHLICSTLKEIIKEVAKRKENDTTSQVSTSQGQAYLRRIDSTRSTKIWLRPKKRTNRVRRRLRRPNNVGKTTTLSKYTLPSTTRSSTTTRMKYRYPALLDIIRKRWWLLKTENKSKLINWQDSLMMLNYRALRRKLASKSSNSKAQRKSHSSSSRSPHSSTPNQLDSYNWVNWARKMTKMRIPARTSRNADILRRASSKYLNNSTKSCNKLNQRILI